MSNLIHTIPRYAIAPSITTYGAPTPFAGLFGDNVIQSRSVFHKLCGKFYMDSARVGARPTDPLTDSCIPFPHQYELKGSYHYYAIKNSHIRSLHFRAKKRYKNCGFENAMRRNSNASL
jgi:hypothetical protein